MAHRNYSLNEVLYPGFVNAEQNLVGSYISPNLQLIKQSSTQVALQGSSGDGIIAASIGGAFRFITTTVTATVPGGQAAGVYNVWITSGVNDPAAEDAGTFDYSFGLKLSAPSGVGAEALSRVIGTYYWTGSQIVLLSVVNRPTSRGIATVTGWQANVPWGFTAPFAAPHLISIQSTAIANVGSAFADFGFVNFYVDGGSQGSVAMFLHGDDSFGRHRLWPKFDVILNLSAGTHTLNAGSGGFTNMDGNDRLSASVIQLSP